MNASIITEDAKQWIVSETARLSGEIATFGSNTTALNASFQAQISAFVDFQNTARNDFVSNYGGQTWSFYTNGTNSIAAHTSQNMAETHAVQIIASNYIDDGKDTVSVRVIQLATTGGTVYAPCSLSPTGPA